MIAAATTGYPVRRNTFLLAACLTCNSGMVQLTVAVSTLTLVLVTGVKSILGLGPAIFLSAAALAALPAGRLMDRVGRVPVLAGGFCLGIAGSLTTALGCSLASATLVIAGFALVGASTGTVQLARTAAADMYPPNRRARGISLVLFGALFGAALGPLVFRPLFAGKELTLDALVRPWLAASAFMVLGLVLALSIRPDPKTIATALAAEETGGPMAPPAPLREILRRPGVPTALVAAFASFSVMVGVMNLSGSVVVGNHHHSSDVFTVISLHIVGMYALVLVIGEVIDRLGRRPSLVGGLVLMGASSLALIWFSSVPLMSVSLFGVGLGWNLSYVAAAAELVEHATPAERGRLIGFNDLCSGLLGAALALLGGVAYSVAGVTAIAVGAAIAVAAPAGLIVVRGRRAGTAVAPA